MITHLMQALISSYPGVFEDDSSFTVGQIFKKMW